MPVKFDPFLQFRDGRVGRGTHSLVAETRVTV